MSRRLPRWLAVAVTAAALSTGCGFRGVYSLPLPGAVGTGSGTYSVDVQLADVLDLVPYSAVKVNGATVGHVKSIQVQGRHALVRCQLLGKVKLPANAIARVEQTSVLGEKFVEIEPPRTEPPTGRLHNGDVIPLARTDTDASVEEVLGALSMLLNGGGVGQLHTITHELSTALDGRVGATRDLLGHLNQFVGGLDSQKQTILRALDGLDSLARAVRQQEDKLVGAVEQMPQAVRILADDRKQLTTMLVSMQHLGDVASRVLNRSHADLVANLEHLQPTLDRLAQVGQDIPKILGTVLTYPTADSVEQEYFGDYGNLSLTLDVSAQSLLNTFGPGPVPSVGATPHARRLHQKAGSGTAGATGSGPAGGTSVPGPTAPLRRWAPGSSLQDLLLGPLS
jgi:phospholipid/cholesterol/gamma-HCH transport system substrate-binding protein